MPTCSGPGRPSYTIEYYITIIRKHRTNELTRLTTIYYTTVCGYDHAASVYVEFKVTFCRRTRLHTRIVHFVHRCVFTRLEPNKNVTFFQHNIYFENTANAREIKNENNDILQTVLGMKGSTLDHPNRHPSNARWSRIRVRIFRIRGLA